MNRRPTIPPHEEAELRAEALKGLIADDLTGPVGDAEWEKVQAQRSDPLEPNWSLQS